MRLLMTFAVCFAGSLATAQDASSLKEAEFLAEVALAQGIETSMVKSVRAIVADRLAAALARQNIKVRDNQQLAARLPDNFIEEMLGDLKARTVDTILRTQNLTKINALAQYIREHQAVLDRKPTSTGDPQQVNSIEEWSAALQHDLSEAKKELSTVMPSVTLHLAVIYGLHQDIMAKPLDLKMPALRPVYEAPDLLVFPNRIARNEFLRSMGSPKKEQGPRILQVHP